MPGVIPTPVNDRPLWDEGDWPGLPVLEGTMTADVCVVGLGGSGLSAVEEALAMGKSVVGIDAGRVAGEAAGRNGGFLLPGMSLFYHEARIRWGVDHARRVYQKTVDEMGRMMSQPSVRHVGSLRIADSDDELADVGDELAALRADGFEAHPYEGPEGEGMSLPGGVCNPMRRCRDLAARLLEDGAVLREQSRAVDVQPGRVVTGSGVVEAEHVVVAVDGRLEVLFPELGERVRTARLEMLATEPAEHRFRQPVYTAFGYVYWQQLPDGRLALGGLRQHFADQSWTADAGPTREVQSALDEYLVHLGFDVAVTHRWAGHASFTTDREPIFEEIRPGVWVVGGYNGHGNVMGSLYGRAAVRSALAGEAEPLL